MEQIRRSSISRCTPCLCVFIINGVLLFIERFFLVYYTGYSLLKSRFQIRPITIMLKQNLIQFFR